MYKPREWIKIEDSFNNLPIELQTLLKKLAQANEQCLAIKDLKMFAPYSIGYFKLFRGKIVFFNMDYEKPLKLENLPAFMILDKPNF